MRTKFRLRRRVDGWVLPELFAAKESPPEKYDPTAPTAVLLVPTALMFTPMARLSAAGSSCSPTPSKFTSSS